MTSRRVDAISLAGKALDPAQHARLLVRVDALVYVAAYWSRAELARRVRPGAGRLEAGEGWMCLNVIVGRRA